MLQSPCAICAGASSFSPPRKDGGLIGRVESSESEFLEVRKALSSVRLLIRNSETVRLPCIMPPLQPEDVSLPVKTNACSILLSWRLDMTESRGALAIAGCWISRSGFVQWSAVLLSFADGLPSDASCRSASEAVAHDIAATAKDSLSLASVLSLMERLRSSTSLIGCLQASSRRRQARKALFNSQVIPSGGSSVIAALISLCHSLDIPVRMYARGVLAELSGSYGNLLRKRGGRRYNAE